MTASVNTIQSAMRSLASAPVLKAGEEPTVILLAKKAFSDTIAYRVVVAIAASVTTSRNGSNIIMAKCNQLTFCLLI